MDANDNHLFLLQPRAWLGQGSIQLSMMTEELTFFTRWEIGHPDEAGGISCVQEIQVHGLADVMSNQFIMYDFVGSSFRVELENQALGKVQGSGFFDKKVIAWEFRVPEIGFEGLEFYEKQSDASYLMRAEYATQDQFRTIIQGQVWQK
jgi:hypothetical protein